VHQQLFKASLSLQISSPFLCFSTFYTFFRAIDLSICHTFIKLVKFYVKRVFFAQVYCTMCWCAGQSLLNFAVGGGGKYCFANVQGGGGQVAAVQKVVGCY